MARFKLVNGEPHYFDFIAIDKQQHLLQKSFELRYEVYCETRNFLDPDDYPTHFETDCFDEHSHVIAAINGDCEVIGTVRLVKPSEEHGLPMQSHCRFFDDFPSRLGASSIDEALRTTGIVELSRLMVSANYLRRANDGYYALSDTLPANQTADDKRNVNRPAIAMGMYREVYRFCRRNGITHWLVAMEKVLCIYLKRHQIVFEPIGPEVDYYGPVTPYMVEIEKVTQRMKARAPALYELWNRGLDTETKAEFGC